MMSLFIALFFALTACSPAAEETFATPTATLAQFVEVEEEATAQKATATATVMAAEATSTEEQAVPEATKTTSAEVAEAKASPTEDSSENEASPTVEATEEQASPTVEASEEQASPTVEATEDNEEQGSPEASATQEQASPTAEATQEQASPTVEATQEQAPTVEAALEQVSPTAEATLEQASPTVEASDTTESETVIASEATATPTVEQAAPTETVAVATWNPLPTSTPEPPATVPPATVAPATPTTVISSAEVTATPDIAGEASDAASILNQIANPNTVDTATPAQETLSYVDRELAIAFEVPADWTIDSQPGAAGGVYAPEEQASLRFSVLSQESKTLELALEEVRQGAFGRYITEVEPVKLGQFDGLRINLAPNDVEGGASVTWVMMTPVGKAIGFIPQGDLTLIESILSTIRGIR